jgi:hypothetical protein
VVVIGLNRRRLPRHGALLREIAAQSVGRA